MSDSARGSCYNTINTLTSGIDVLDPVAEYGRGDKGLVGGSPMFPSPAKTQYNGLDGEELGTEREPTCRRGPALRVAWRTLGPSGQAAIWTITHFAISLPSEKCRWNVRTKHPFKYLVSSRA